jgi:hypothetical protein
VTRPVPPSALPWAAWRRAGKGRWAKVGEYATEAEAWAAIYAAMKASGPGHYESVVLRAGEKP